MARVPLQGRLPRRPRRGTFLAVGVTATAGMFLIQPGGWRLAALLYALGNIGVAGAQAFYDSLLPHIAREDEVDRLSGAATRSAIWAREC